MTLILASKSAVRQMMLNAAGVPFTSVPARVDEESAKAGLRAQGLSARNVADALAELKAIRVAQSHPGELVLGCDQTLERDDGVMFDQPGDDVAAQLRALSGRSHTLHSAAVAVENGQPVWRAIESVTMTMRTLSSEFIVDYVAEEGASVAGIVGSYRIEGPGIQLFSKIEGSHFAILGLPLLPLLAWLRVRGLVAS